MILAGPANGITIRVPQDYAKIQSAINAAHNDDKIVVSPGVYVEIINFMGKNIVLRSTDPMSTATIAATIIDGNRKGAVVVFAGTETSSCVLSGFTVRNGTWGVYGDGTRARIEHNTISGNWGDSGGGLYGCNGTIQNNTITGNAAIASSYGDSVKGGGLYQCNGTIQNNTITGNSVQGGNAYGGGLYQCNGTIQNNTIGGNCASGTGHGRGGGLYQCNGTIQNNVITGNSAIASSYDGSGSGGGLYQCNGVIRNNTIAQNTNTGLLSCGGTIVNCIIWQNSRYQLGSGCAVPSYCCIQGYTGGGVGNTAADPRFRGPNDFHLQSNSPCIDGGTNANCPTFDMDGTPRPYDGNRDGTAVCDMGAYEWAVPGVPGTPVDEGQFTSSTGVRFSWTAPQEGTGSPVASYELQVGKSPGASDVFNGNVGNVLARTVSGANGQQLYARVRARDAGGNTGLWSGNSDGILIDTVPPTVPGTPSDTGAYTSSAVAFSWTAAGDAGSAVASYDLQVGTTPGANNVFNANVGNVLAHTVTGGDGETLYARVRARDGAGNLGTWSGNSDGILIDTVAPTTPSAPTDSGAYTSSTSVRFNWTAAMDRASGGSGVASYDLQIGTSPGGSNILNANIGNVLTRTVTGANGQTLYARVRARDRASNIGAWSGSSDGITVDTVRPRLTAVTALDCVTLQVTFDEPVSNADRISNYTCTRGLNIISAMPLSDSQYRLKTTRQQTATTYVLTVQSGVTDRASNPIDPVYRSRAFVGGTTAANRWEMYR